MIFRYGEKPFLLYLWIEYNIIFLLTLTGHETGAVLGIITWNFFNTDQVFDGVQGRERNFISVSLPLEKQVAQKEINFH